MKKATTKPVKRKTKAVARPDSQIDTSDIPEITDWSGAVRGLFTRSPTQQISIRLDTGDLAKASRLAARKGLPYQTYIKSLLHEALENESRRSAR